MSSPPPPPPPQQQPTSPSSPSPTPSPSPEPDTNAIQDFVPLPPPDQHPSAPPHPNGDSAVALYAFFPATAAELLAIARACHADLVADGSWGGASGATSNIFHPAPEPLFLPANQGDGEQASRIEDVVAYHRAAILRSPGWRRFFDREHLAVARTPAWRTEGVTLATVSETWLREVGDGGEAYRRGWDAWTFRAEAVGSVVVNLQICNMGWAEFTTWRDVQPEGREPDGRRGDILASMLEGECGEERREWAEGLVRECEERDELVYEC